MSFSRRGIISTLFRISFHCKEFKLFNYLMTGPKKCEDWARPGVSSNKLFIREQSRAAAKHIAAPAVTPTHPGINCIFISGLSEFWARNQMQNALFITFFASSVSLRVPWLINLSSITLYLLLVVAHYARCWHWNITRSRTRFARGISENHSPVTRERDWGGGSVTW